MKINEKQGEFRLRSIAIFVAIASFVVLWKMVDVQLLNHDHYLALAQGQQRFEKTKMAERGKVYVHDSAVDPSVYYPLAFDVKKFAVWVVPSHIKDKEKMADNLSSLVGLDRKEIFDKINNDKLYIPPVKRGLNLDEANKIKAGDLAGVYVMPEYSRYYPEGPLASHLLGFVNNSGEGNYGVEGYYDDELRGREGNVKGEKDTLGRVINLLEEKDPQNGANYVLTVDRSAQYFIEKKLQEALVKYQAASGSVVVMDVKTGGIVAMASLPSYDPNTFREQASTNAGAFVNPVIAHLYEPGSIMKTINMAAALSEGVVTPETKESFSNYTVVDGYEIHTAEDKAFGEETMTQVLENSDNVAMVWLSEKMGKEKMYKYLKAFNFFDKTGIDLDTEVAGLTPALKTWRNINRATISFGQGISVTSLQMVAAYAAIANQGRYIYPHIIDKIVYPDGGERKIEKHEGEQVIKPESAIAMREMLYSVVKNGHSKRAAVPGFKIAAKTGTAQIPKPEGGYEESEDGLGIFNHTLAGFAPADDPQFALLVKLEKPKAARYAESTAAPLFGEISSFLLNYHYRLKPTEPIQ
ncbi:MAG TPA: penicillin-binding protein 2 [bacterium]|nr:penicillin-binding protein 2 [bacterium]